MIKEIKYNGYSASPSDYQCPDGDMASMLNCIPERGAFKPVLPPKTVKSFGEETSVLAIHKVANKERYILYDGNKLTWEDVEDYRITGELYDFKGDNGAVSVTSIGNTLAVLDGNGMIHYFLWRNDAYSNLGQLPELNANPYIFSQIYDIRTILNVYEGDYDNDYDPNAAFPTLDKSKYQINGDGMISDEQDINKIVTRSGSVKLKGSVQQNVYEKIFAHLNLINRLLQRDGIFTAPFYVRFAYRLYDGSYAAHTVPVLMTPTTLGAPLLNCHTDDSKNVYFEPLYTASRLTMALNIPDSINDWGDIIQSVDVFVTPPLINYSDSPFAVKAIKPLIETNISNGVLDSQYLPGPYLMDTDKKWRPILEKYESRANDNYSIAFSGPISSGQKVRFDGKSASARLFISASNTDAKLTNSKGKVYSFTLLSESVSGLPSGLLYATIARGEIYTFEGEDDTATAYAAGIRSDGFWDANPHRYVELSRVDDKDYQDILTDYANFYRIASFDFKDYRKGFIGMVPIKKTVLENLTVQHMLSDLGGSISNCMASSIFSYNNRINVIVQGENLPPCLSLLNQNPARGERSDYTLDCAYVKVVENSQTSYIRVEDEYSRVGDLKLVYFAYPKATATELQIYYTDSSEQPYVRTIPLTRHPFLNLAYAFNMFDAIKGNFTECSTIPDYPQTSILYGNKIKTSNVNNPFIFSEENTSELPVGEIFALSTAAKALSQGQFGQFPLYAFTDKGVWALEVTSTGTYSARQPITRDVVLDAKSVTQIDDAVLFATERGIMLLSGSQVQCISEVLDGKAFDWEQYGFAYKKTGELGLPTFVVPWEQYKAKIQMLYDYTGQRIIVFNPQYPQYPQYGHAYVFSLDSKQWGIMESNIKSTVDYYPRAYAMTHSGDLVDYSAADKDFAEGYYITRPLKLDTPDVHKTITGIIQRGQFKKGHVNTMLYGSRDLEKWYPVYGSADHILRGMRGTPYKYFRIASTFHLECDESITGCSVDYEPRLNNKLR